MELTIEEFKNDNKISIYNEEKIEDEHGKGTRFMLNKPLTQKQFDKLNEYNNVGFAQASSKMFGVTYDYVVIYE